MIKKIFIILSIILLISLKLSCSGNRAFAEFGYLIKPTIVESIEDIDSEIVIDYCTIWGFRINNTTGERNLNLEIYMQMEINISDDEQLVNIDNLILNSGDVNINLDINRDIEKNVVNIKTKGMLINHLPYIEEDEKYKLPFTLIVDENKELIFYVEFKEYSEKIQKSYGEITEKWYDKIANKFGEYLIYDYIIEEE